MGKKNEERKTRANRASVKRIRISPRKVRMVLNEIRGMNADEAIEVLQFTNKRSAPIILKLIDQAMTNIENSEELSDWDLDELTVAQAYADEGPTLRRFKPRAQGRATRINKRTSHVTIVLEPAK